MILRALLIWLCFASTALAQVTLDPKRSSVSDGWWRLEIDLALSGVAPYRVYTLDAPRRLVVDVQGLAWDQTSAPGMLEPGRATGLRVDQLDADWTRVVIDLAEPLKLAEVSLSELERGARLRIVAKTTSDIAFAAAAGPPPSMTADQMPVTSGTETAETDNFIVVIDPGHGGIDPGAARGGVFEANLMLALGHEVAAALADHEDVSVVLTRDDDAFVPLAGRISFARAAGADLLISLHADALEEDEARGASVYTLALGGGNAAARRMVERHEAGDILGGVDLTGQGDEVANALMDMARQETGPEGRAFADTLVRALREQGVPLTGRPRRQGQLAVLASADFPAVLVEAGFLSNADDLARLRTVEGRTPLVAALVGAILTWRMD